MPPVLAASSKARDATVHQRVQITRLSYSWLVLVWTVFVAAATGSLVAVSQENLLAAVLAVANVILTGLVCFRILVVNPVSGLVPTFFLFPIVMLGSVSTLYFCIFSPDIFATFAGNECYLLKDNAFFQSTVMTCIASVALPWLLFQRQDRTLDKYAAFRRAAFNATTPTFLAFVATVVSMLVLRILSIGATTSIGYVVYGLFRYTHALPLIAGAAWGDLPKRNRYFILSVLAINTLMNTATNSRYYAFMPAAFFAAGIMFLSSVPVRRKYISLLAIACVVGGVLVIGNAGRRLGVGLWYGGVEDLQRRYEVLTQKSDQVMNVRWGDEIFGRMFFMGGLQITTLMPQTLAFKRFDLPIYVAEVVTQGFLPRNLASRLITPYHEEKSSLVAIGHKITEKHSVERSFIGAAWEVGGFGPLIAISFVTGCFLLLVNGVIEQQLLPRTPRMAVVCYAIFYDSVLKSMNEGLPSLAHECIYSVIVGTVVYAMVWFLGNTFARRSFLYLPRLKTELRRVGVST